MLPRRLSSPLACPKGAKVVRRPSRQSDMGLTTLGVLVGTLRRRSRPFSNRQLGLPARLMLLQVRKRRRKLFWPFGRLGVWPDAKETPQVMRRDAVPGRFSSGRRLADVNTVTPNAARELRLVMVYEVA